MMVHSRRHQSEWKYSGDQTATKHRDLAKACWSQSDRKNTETGRFRAFPTNDLRKGTSGERSWRNVSSGRNRALLDTFGKIEIARQAKADHTLVFNTRARAWLRFSSDPLH